MDDGDANHLAENCYLPVLLFVARSRSWVAGTALSRAYRKGGEVPHLGEAGGLGGYLLPLSLRRIFGAGAEPNGLRELQS